MADKSMQLVIGVDIKDVNAAINKTKALESQVKRIVDAHRSGKIDIDNYNRGLSETKKSYDSVSASSRKSSAEIRKLAKQFNEAYDTKSISSVINKTNSLEAEVKKIVVAYRAGKISTAEYNKGLLQTKRAYDSISPSSQKATAEVRKLAKEFNRAYDTQEQVANLKRLEAEQTRAFAAARREATLINQQKIIEARAAAKAVSDAAKQEIAAFRAARKEAELMNEQFDMERAEADPPQGGNPSNRRGVAIQQLGYQVGDFIVQVQSGTNAFVAFGQQATQLVGILPLVATQLGLTTMAAIGISTALGIAIPLITAVGAAWWRSSEESKKAKEELDELDSRIKSIDESLQDWIRTKKAAEAGMTVDEMFGGEKIEQVKDKIKNLQEYIKKIDNTISNPTSLTEWPLLLGLLGQKVLGTNEDALAELNRQLADATTRLTELRNKQASDRARLYVTETREIQQQIALQKLAAEKGEKSAEYLRLQAIQRKFNTEQQIKSLDLEDWQKKKLIEINNELIDGQLALELSALAAEQLAAVDIEKGIAQAATRAGQLAKELGISFETAKKMMALGLDKKKELILDPRDPRYNSAAATAARLRAEAGTVSPFDPIRQPKEVTATTTSGGKEDPAIKMLQEIDRRKVLIGLTEEQAKRQELVYQTEDKLGEFREKYGNDFINNIVNQTMALDEQQKVLDEAKAKQKEVGDLISSSMEDAFMSIVDGTKSVKDAFKSMAASIISELYRIFVIKKIVGGITGFLPFADGGVFSGGSVVPSAKGNIFSGGNVVPFANGGVVSSPMTFPMTGGKTGLMGEAGPEAIMPLKRGKGGKLGVVAENNGNVVIHQNFNFSANGDESVKKIIAQAAPQIAQMTKTSIINDRRRGGSTLAAFGR